MSTLYPLTAAFSGQPKSNQTIATCLFTTLTPTILVGTLYSEGRTRLAVVVLDFSGSNTSLDEVTTTIINVWKGLAARRIRSRPVGQLRGTPQPVHIFGVCPMNSQILFAHINIMLLISVPPMSPTVHAIVQYVLHISVRI
ncbi:unnamed protein product, partial [Ectocarpus fasciculatus]